MKKGVINLTISLLAVVAFCCIGTATAWGESLGCIDCHDGVTQADFGATTGCIDCHGVHTDCYSCHFEDPSPGENPHHATTYADNGMCEHCHADPRPDTPGWNSEPGDNGYLSGLDVPTQMACRQCHVKFANGQMTVTKFERTDYEKYKVDYIKTTIPSHTIDNPTLAALGRINNYGACLSCHGVQIWHARPDKHSSSWVMGEWDELRCTGSRAAWDPRWPPPDNQAKYLPGRSSGTISSFNLFVEPGFGFTPGQYDYDPCSDAHLYQSSPYNYKVIQIPQLTGNGMTSGAVPVFPSLCPMTSAGVENCPMAPPELITEPATYCVDNCPVTLEWYATSDPPDITEVDYWLQVDNNANFSSPVYNSGWIPDTSDATSALTPRTVYHWRVKATDRNNPADETPWSSKGTFYIDGPITQLNPPTLYWPANNYSGQVGWPIGQNPLQWNPVLDGNQYRVEIRMGGNSCSNGTVVSDSGWKSGTSYNPGDLSDNNWYYWHVKARASSNPVASESDWSVCRKWYDYWW
ncbi:hypothetical protein ACFLYW_00180 [Thermodesulfobacteriota bacterium]